MMKVLFSSLLVLGLLVGPGYWVYGKFYTGSEAALLTLTAAPEAEGALPSWQSGEFSLHEAMAPVGLVLIAHGHLGDDTDQSTPPKDLYTATLYRGDEAAKPLGFSLSMKRFTEDDQTFHEHLLLMQKVHDGHYRMVVSGVNPPRIHVDEMQVQVRQNLHEPNPHVVTVGVVLFVLGIFGLVLV